MIAVQPESVTRDQFEAEYASLSGVTVEQLHNLGRYAVPCDCGDEMCDGWAMEYPEPDALA